MAIIECEDKAIQEIESEYNLVRECNSLIDQNYDENGRKIRNNKDEFGMKKKHDRKKKKL